MMGNEKAADAHRCTIIIGRVDSRESNTTPGRATKHHKESTAKKSNENVSHVPIKHVIVNQLRIACP